MSCAAPGRVKSGCAGVEDAVGVGASPSWHPVAPSTITATQASAARRRGEVTLARVARRPALSVTRQTGGVVDLTLPAVAVAPALLGAVVTHGEVAVRLTEVEAYAGVDDPAAHAAAGPRPRTRALFGEPGTLYCYLSHGLHICGNVVCGAPGGGSAVLLRAGEVVVGHELARARRPGVPDVALARGPGCLGRVLGWTLADSGALFGQAGLSLVALTAEPVIVRTGPRVGVSVAHERPWRFWIDGDPTVSAYRRSPRITPEGLRW